MKVYEIVKQVQVRYRGLCTRLEERTRTSKQSWQSHGVEPFTMNPESYGKPSPADHFVDLCQEYEAAMPGAGLMISEAIAAELRDRFTRSDGRPCQREIRQDLLKEATEALQKLDECDFDEANIPKLNEMLAEVRDVINTGSHAAGKLLSIIRQRELGAAQLRAVARLNGNGRAKQ